MAEGNTGSSGSGARPDPLVGRRLASYEVLARVARGGMGVVYRARHVYIDKIVALKVLDPALAERSDLIERFRTEAQSLARVEHDNVVKVIDILEDKGVHFIVMDFAEGTNLRNLVKDKGPLNGDALLSVARQTAEALYAAHREGILHRDIKPENLILNSRGRCKLADFGLAGDLRLISEGHEGPLNFGTPAYSAPEVMRRMVPDKRSDIFSYGATLYFLATGEPPFGQTGAQQIMLRQKQGAELLDSRRPDLPPKFTQIVMDCIKYHPKDRPSGFIEVLERLPRRMLTRNVPGTPTNPTDPTDAVQLDSGTHETPELEGNTRRLLVGAATLATVAVGVVLFFLISSLLNAPADNTVGNVPENTPGPANKAPANHEPKQPGTISNKQPAGNGGPAFRPEDEAFNAAELESRAAQSNANYKGAFDAWAKFIKAYPNSGYVADAKEKQTDLTKRVGQLRGHEYDKAKKACDNALKDKRTADALAALERFPAELLVPLNRGDEVSVQQKLDTQRQVVIAVEATDLARLLERADAIRAEWQSDQDKADQLSVERRMANAGNLLRERDLLEEFLAGRTDATQAKVNKRLASLRKLLESVHQDAAIAADAWRNFQDETLGEWAASAVKLVDDEADNLSKRKFKEVLDAVDALDDKLTSARDKASAAAPDAQLARHIAGSKFVLAQLDRYRGDLKQAEKLVPALQEQLRAVRRTNKQYEFLVHAEVEADGKLSARLDKYTGRVTGVGSSDFTLEDDGRRVSVDYDMLSANTTRRLIHDGGTLDGQVSLLAWLVALGRKDDVDTEFARLERMRNVPDAIIDHARAMHEAGCLAPEALNLLRYLVRRSDKTSPHDTTPLPRQSLIGRLLTAQQGVTRGDVQAANDYVAAVREVADPELVNVETYETALGAADHTVGDLKSWTVLEPLNPVAWAALAQGLADDGQASQARLAAGRALVIDGSNDAAWKIWNK